MQRGKLMVRVFTYATLAVLAALVFLMLIGTVEAGWTGDQCPVAGDWNINQDTFYWDETVTVPANINVNSPYTLRFENCTVIMTSTSMTGGRTITVNNGAMLDLGSIAKPSTLRNTAITGRYYLYVYGSGAFKGSTLRDVYYFYFTPQSAASTIYFKNMFVTNTTYLYLNYQSYNPTYNISIVKSIFANMTGFYFNNGATVSDSSFRTISTLSSPRNMTMNKCELRSVSSTSFSFGLERGSLTDLTGLVEGSFSVSSFSPNTIPLLRVRVENITSFTMNSIVTLTDCRVTSRGTMTIGSGYQATILRSEFTNATRYTTARFTCNSPAMVLDSRFANLTTASFTNTATVNYTVFKTFSSTISFSGASTWLWKDTFDTTYMVQVSGAAAWIDSCSVKGTQYGLDSYGVGHVGNLTIDIVYRPTTTQSPSTVRGLGLYNKGINLYNIAISITYDFNYTYSLSSSWSVQPYIYGLYVSGANIGHLSKVNITSINIDQRVHMHNYFITSYVYLYAYMYTYGIYLTGATVCPSIKDISVNVKQDFYGASYNNSVNGYLYYYDYMYLIYSTISATGKAPIEISGITIKDMTPSVRYGGRTNIFNPQYTSRYMFYLNEAKDSRAVDAVVSIHHVTVTNSLFGYVMWLPVNQVLLVKDCTFSDLRAYWVIYSNGLQKAWTINECDFVRITAINTPRYNGRPFLYIYGAKGEGELSNCTFDALTGTSMLYLSYQADRTVIEYNTISNCIQWKDTSDNWFYINYNSDKIEVRLNTFMNNDARNFVGIYYNTKRVVFEDNDFRSNIMQDWLLRIYGNNEEIDLSLNTFESNTGNMLLFEYTYRQVNLEKNVITRNMAKAGYLLRTTYTQNGLRLADNDVNNNTADGALLYFIGPTYWYWPGFATFAVDRNTFSDNVASSAVNGGIIVIRGARYDTPVRRNSFYNNVGNCINFYRPYNYYTYETTWTMTVDGNYFEGNRDPATVWVDISTYNVVVKRNSGKNNLGPLVKTIFTAHYVYDTSMQPYFYGEVRGAYTFDVDYNVWTQNLGGAIDIRAMWRDTYTIASLPEQQVSVRNNVLDQNAGAYCIKIVDFGAAPLMVNNQFKGSDYGVFLQAIDYRAYWPRLQLSFSAESFDGGPNGVTAWALVNGDAEFTNCRLENYREALYVKDGTINVWWSAIPERSGRTEGRGYIYVYNHLELYVTWSDANGVDSGKPAAGATVAMLGSNGRYLDKLATNDEGRLGPMVVQPWTCVEGRMDAWSPFSTTVLSGGLTGIYIIHVIGEKVGADAAHLVLQDTVTPSITVTAPSEGSISNLLDMPVEGFLFETGSGVSEFRGWVDSGVPRDIIPTGVWSSLFAGLAPGEHTLWLELKDLAGNRRTEKVSFTIDAAPPVLILTSPEDGLITANPAIDVRGTFSDDLSDLVDIVVRINGIRTNPGTPGVLLEPFTLTEGVNGITIDATDAAGNRASVTLTVTLDTYPPTLYVYNPLDRLLTPDDMLTVDGLSDAGTVLKVEVMQGGVAKDEETVVARSDGTFVAAMTLFEGPQTIVVTARDSPANNVRVVSRVVTLDTTAPTLVIDSPAAGAKYFKTAGLTLIGHIEDPIPDKVVVKVNGKPVPHSGTFTVQLTLVEGPNSIVVTAEDEVGNVATQTVDIIRDTVRPELEVDVPAFLLTNDADLLLRGMVNKDAAKVEVRGDEVTVDENGQFRLTLDLSAETSPIVVVATDLAGNSATYTIDFIYDGTDPVLTLDAIVSQTSDPIAFVNGSVNDDKSTISHVMIRGNPFSVVDGRFMAIIELGTAGDGWNNFTVVAEDEAGNVATRYVNIHWVAPPPADTTEDGGPSNEALSWVGLVFLAAGITLVLTAWFLSRRPSKEVGE